MYSFFTRNLQPLATDLVELLQKSQQWVDPNLLLLVKGDESSKAKQRKGKISSANASSEPRPEEDSDSDEFKALAGSRIALKRSKNVSDTSGDESSSDTSKSHVVDDE